MPFTDAEKETIMQLWNEGGRSASKIAALVSQHRCDGLVVGRNAVIGLINSLRRHGVSVRRVKPEESVKRWHQANGAAKPKAKLPGKKPRSKPFHFSENAVVPPEITEADRAQAREQHLRRAPGQIDIPFMSRKSGECAWPAWADTQKIGPVCGLPTDEDKSFCKFHHAAAYTKTGA